MKNTSIKILFTDISEYISGKNTLKMLKENIGSKLIDLLFYIPYRLISAKYCYKWEELEENKKVAIKVRVIKHYRSFKYIKAPYRIIVSFDKKTLYLVFFSKYTSYLNKIYEENKIITITGTLAIYNKKFQILHPEIIKTESIIKSKNNIKLLYKQKGGLKSKTIHNSIRKCLGSIPNIEEWNVNLLDKYNCIPSWQDSIRNLHNAKIDNILTPSSSNMLRLAYDEILATQLSLAIIRKSIEKEKSNAYKKKYIFSIKEIEKYLHFRLTKSQTLNLKEIINDLYLDKPMLRLLHGDVGSGKTIVAFLSAIPVILSGYQVAVLVPTELLAKQHLNFIKSIFSSYNIKVILITSNSANKSDNLKKISTGEISFIIGTHALIQESIKFKKLSYVIIDEQHRFGVVQRLKIKKKGKKVDMLLLSATPIPRTMLLATLGDISVSTITEKPFNNKVNTILKSNKNINQIIKFLKIQLNKKNKVFWICPKIDADEEKNNIASIENRFKLLNKEFNSVELLHGKLDANLKDQTLKNFRDGKTKVLISTIVIEVGIDIPDANIILIDHADRFGLAQIHQLRGRVGRGTENGICILMYNEPINEISYERLKILKESDNGFEIAEKDLLLRGGGEILGKKQYGYEVFKFFDLLHHKTLLEMAITEADSIILKDPFLESSRGKLLINLLYLFEKEKALNLISAG